SQNNPPPRSSRHTRAASRLLSSSTCHVWRCPSTRTGNFSAANDAFTCLAACKDAVSRKIVMAARSSATHCYAAHSFALGRNPRISKFRIVEQRMRDLWINKVTQCFHVALVVNVQRGAHYPSTTCWQLIHRRLYAVVPRMIFFHNSTSTG